ncbi:MAG: alkaline phosphatase D family protein [Proteobacteria bacterium]|nr:alkaline phosphatase D family protein [Pseudomonadota bacterium]
MRIDRRGALALLGLGAAAPLKAAAEVAPVAAADARFLHGVASGDPLADRLVIWTRVTAEGAAPIPVRWEVSESADFARPAASGVTQAAAPRDFTVKVDVTGLKPGQDYWYRFLVGGRTGGATSAVGRARTLPSGPTADLVLAVVTCSLYPQGWFNAYHHIAGLDRLDAVVELGDYIYEYGGPGSYGMEMGDKLGRAHEPAHDCVTLADYRTRHAQYKRDPDLQAAHARAPWICVWDDHEVANDDWIGGAENHHDKTEGDWRAREQAALRAYYEWMPIREPEPGRAFEAINRSFQFGDLASLIMVESRLMARSYQLERERPDDVGQAIFDASGPGRPRQVTDPAVIKTVREAMAAANGRPPAPYIVGPDLVAVKAYVEDPARQMLGPAQEAWLGAELRASVEAGRPWQVLGNEVVMARMLNPDARGFLGAAGYARLLAGKSDREKAYIERVFDALSIPAPYDLDAWNGYPAARERVYDAIKSAPGANTLVLSGDSHAFWVNDLADAAGTRVAVEFGTSAITSPGMGDHFGFQAGEVFVAQNPEVKHCDQVTRGYIRLTLSHAEARAELIGVETAAKPYKAEVTSTWTVAATKGPGIAAPKKV